MDCKIEVDFIDYQCTPKRNPTMRSTNLNLHPVAIPKNVMYPNLETQYQIPRETKI